MSTFPQYDLQILDVSLLKKYLEEFPTDFQSQFDALKDAEISTADFSFYTSVSSVFSSKIEGENIALDSYVKHKRFEVAFNPDYTKKTDDLYEAYRFAQDNPLNADNFAASHRLLARHIVAESQLGKFRNQNMFVTTEDGKIEYVAAEPAVVPNAMQSLYNDIAHLLRKELTFGEVFFFASLIHLTFVKIHPWSDGNGRSARLIEKWFLAEKLGEKAWYVQSEKYYYQHHQTYYANIRAIGLEYPELNYSEAFFFLKMLPSSLSNRER